MSVLEHCLGLWLINSSVILTRRTIHTYMVYCHKSIKCAVFKNNCSCFIVGCICNYLLWVPRIQELACTVYSCCGNDHFPPIVPSSPPPYIGKLYIIVEFCSKGNLLMFLRSKRNDHQSPLTVRSSVDMAAQVATGMEFLASKKVHKYGYLSYCILYTLH